MVGFGRFVVVCAVLAGCSVGAAKKDLKGWVRKGELGEKPKAVTDSCPLSDQGNRGGWVVYGALTDEFGGERLNSRKWWPKNPRWLGRQPGYFYEGNVSVSGGKLHLKMKKEEVAEMPKDKGYHTYTSSAVQSKGVVKYGYFEVKAKPMDSHGSSSFWFYNNQRERWTEIDVFEIGGGAPGFEKRYNMNVHVFHTPTEKEHWSKHGQWENATRLADGYHV